MPWPQGAQCLLNGLVVCFRRGVTGCPQDIHVSLGPPLSATEKIQLQFPGWPYWALNAPCSRPINTQRSPVKSLVTSFSKVVSNMWPQPMPMARAKARSFARPGRREEHCEPFKFQMHQPSSCRFLSREYRKKTTCKNKTKKIKSEKKSTQACQMCNAIEESMSTMPRSWEWLGGGGRW